MSTLTTDLRQGLHSGIAYKAPARAATTAPITLSGLQTVDDVVLVAGDRVLVKNQASGIENGIYIANTSAWSRAPDWNGEFDIRCGTQVRVNSEGTASPGVWYVTTVDPISIGSTSISFGHQGINDVIDLFPNVTGEVTPTHTELNYVDGVTSAIQTQLNAKAALAGATFTGPVKAAQGQLFSYGAGGDNNQGVLYGNSTGTQYLTNVNNAWTCTGSLQATDFTIPSDARLKENIRVISNPMDILNGLVGCRFNYINGGKEAVGLIAQDVAKSLPEAAVTAPDGFIGVSYSQLIAPLIEAVKELNAEVQKLKARQ